MTNPRTVEVYINGERITFMDAEFTIHPDQSATITINGETRAYFSPFRYDYIITE